MMWKKMVLAMSAVCLAVVLIPDVAQAQRWGGRRGGASAGVYTPYGSFGYNDGRNYRGNYYYGESYNRPYYSNSGYNSPYYSTNPGYGYRYNSGPTYYYDSGTTVLAPSTTTTQSFYSPPTKPAQNEVWIRVMVPDADAQVTFDGAATQQKGGERMFASSLVDTRKTYTYSIRATWRENGVAKNREKTLQVQAGQEYMVDFR